MKTETTRIMIAAAPDMEPIMNEAKKIFDYRSQSEMIRELIVVGLKSVKKNQVKPAKKS